MSGQRKVLTQINFPYVQKEYYQSILLKFPFNYYSVLNILAMKVPHFIPWVNLMQPSVVSWMYILGPCFVFSWNLSVILHYKTWHFHSVNSSWALNVVFKLPIFSRQLGVDPMHITSQCHKNRSDPSEDKHVHTLVPPVMDHVFFMEGGFRGGDDIRVYLYSPRSKH